MADPKRIRQMRQGLTQQATSIGNRVRQMRLASQPQADPLRTAGTIRNQLLRLQALGIEPPEQEFQPSLLQTIFNILDAPRRALAGGVLERIPGLEGISDPTQYAEERLGIENPVLRTIASFGLHMLTDPLTFLTLGVGNVAAQGGRQLVMRAGLPFLTRTAEIALPGTQRLAQAIDTTTRGLRYAAEPIIGPIARQFQRARTPRELLLDPAAEQEFRSATEAVFSAERAQRGLGQAELSEMAARLAPFQAQLTDDEMRIVAMWVDDPQRIARSEAFRALPPERQQLVREMGGEIARLNEDLLRLERAAGIEYEPVKHYIYHLYENPPWQVDAVYQAREAERVRRRTAAPEGFTRRRGYLSFEEAINAGLTPVLDPIRIQAVRTMVSVKRRVMGEMLQQLKRIGDEGTGKVITRLPRGAQPPSGWVRSGSLLKDLEGYALHPELANAIRELDTAITDSVKIQEAFSAVNKITAIWKGLVTTTPGFHFRNILGNVFNMALADIPFHEQFRWWNEAVRVLRLSGSPNEIVQLGGRNYTIGEIMDHFQRENLFGFGAAAERQGAREVFEVLFGQRTDGLAERIQQALSEGRLSPVRVSRQVGELIETQSKMALYLEGLARGLDFDEAAQRVRKYLFDYNDLTKTERALRTFIPFYTWSRKQLPLLIESVFTNPGIYLTLGYANKAMTEAAGLSPEEIPDWLREGMAFPIRSEDGTVHFVEPNLPSELLARIIPGRPGETFREMVLAGLNPLIRVPMEIAMNQQFFSGSPITARQHQMRQVPNPLSLLGMGPEAFNIPAETAYALRQLPLPFPFNVTGNIGAVPMLGAPSLAQELFQRRQEEDVLPPLPTPNPMQALLSLLALSTLDVPVNPERQAAIQELLYSRELTDLITSLRRDLGIDVPTVDELRGGRRSRQERIRRLRQRR